MMLTSVGSYITTDLWVLGVLLVLVLQADLDHNILEDREDLYLLEDL